MRKSVIFDVGRVLFRWDMRLLFAKLISDPDLLERFCTTVITPEWHYQHDEGRPLADMVAERIAKFPEHAALIHAYAERFNETIPGPVEGMVELVEELDAARVPLFIITNFGADLWAGFHPTQPLFERFRGILVSGVERLAKPDPAIYRLALERFGLVAKDALFTDDREDNVAGAQSVGIDSHLFVDASTTRTWLRGRGLPV